MSVVFWIFFVVWCVTQLLQIISGNAVFIITIKVLAFSFKWFMENVKKVVGKTHKTMSKGWWDIQKIAFSIVIQWLLSSPWKSLYRWETGKALPNRFVTDLTAQMLQDCLANVERKYMWDMYCTIITMTKTLHIKKTNKKKKNTRTISLMVC